MFGNTVGSLHVTRQYVVGTDGKDQLWSVSGSQGDNWVKAEVFNYYDCVKWNIL